MIEWFFAGSVFGGPPPIFILIAVLFIGYLVNKKIKKKGGGFSFGGGGKKADFKRPRRLEIENKAEEIPNTRGGDYCFAHQTSDGTVYTAPQDHQNWPGGGKAFFGIMRHGKNTTQAPGVPVLKSSGKGTIFIHNDKVYSLNGHRGDHSLWDGTQHWKFRDTNNKVVSNGHIQQVPGLGGLDVQFAQVDMGPGQKYKGKDPERLVYIRATKEKFDDWKTSAGSRIRYLENEKDPFNIGQWKKGGDLLDVNGKPISPKRNGHMNDVTCTWEQDIGTHVLWISDFFAKTLEVWYRDPTVGGDRFGSGWRFIKRLDDAGSKSGYWRSVYASVGLPFNRGRHGITGSRDEYYEGFWGFKAYQDKRGRRLSAGGWPGAFDKGITIGFHWQF